jgi:hypothetical protein
VTQRYCFIGNSHLSALKLAWMARKPAANGLDVDMFGSLGESLEDTRVQNGRLVPTTSFVANYFKITGGANEIDLSRYSAFIVVGAGFAPARILGLYSRFRHAELNTNEGRLLSQDCFAAAAAGLLRSSSAMHVASALRNATDKPVWMVPTPWPSELAVADPDPKNAASLKLAVAHGDQEQLLATFERSCETASKENIGVVHQPAETKASPILTQDVYSRGSIKFTEKLDEAHDKTDYLHMNRQYGEMLLSKLL